MVFKRRNPRTWAQLAWETIYPRGGWARAFRYVQYRLHRLPDTPERIARGIWAGVFTSFSPLFGMHFIVAAIIARLMKGNIIAALTATFFGNPLTYLPIAITSLKTGHLLLGRTLSSRVENSLGALFADAWHDLWSNLLALFTDRDADWSGLLAFFDEVFLPYLVGGLIPGAIAGTVCYYISVPLIRAYQNTRRKRIRAKFEAIKARAAQADEGNKAK